MKKLVSYFIKYSVSTNILIVGFVLLGYLGFKNLKSSFFPLVESKFISISVSYPGASPQEMEEGVVLKIEDNLKGIIGVDRVTSTSSENSATISIETIEGYDINNILADVKNAVDKVPNFPTGMEPAVVAKVEPTRETISFVVTGEEVPLKTLKTFARTIENDLRRIDGISQVSISGYPDEEIEIAVRENDLQAYNLTFQEVANAVSSSNIITTGGSVKTQAEEYLIRAKNRNYYSNDLDNLIVKTNSNGTIIRLQDVASVTDKWNETPIRGYYNGKQSVRVQVSNTNSEDLLSSAEKVKEYIAKFNETHSHVNISVTRDSSIPLNQRTELLFKNAWQGILLVLLFLSLFLKPRLAFWVAFGMPVAFFGMFMLASFFNITINVLSLFGMIIVIGILVDDGIVIAENIYHHHEKGKGAVRAAIDGTLEVVPSILSAITTTILAFSIFFFLEGNIGDFFGEVAIVVTLTLVVSLIEALIILPAHVAHSKSLDRNQKSYKLNIYADRFMNFIRDKMYAPALHFLIHNKFIGLVLPFAFLLITIGAFQGGIIRGAFFPQVASDRVSVTLTMPQGTNEQITDSIISSIETKVWKAEKEFRKKYSTEDVPVVENVIKSMRSTSVAALNINLLPGEKRSFSAGEITNAIQKEVGKVYGVESLTFGSGGNFGGSPVSVSLLSNNIEDLKAAKQELKQELLKNEELKDVTDNDPQGIKEIKIKLKDNAYLLGLTLNSVMSQVRSGFFGQQAQRFQRGQDEIKVWVRYVRNERSSIKNLDDMRIVTPSGSRVPLSEIATYEIERGEVAINHLEGQREIQVNADIKDVKATSSTDILNDIKTRIMPEITAKYPSVTALYEGQNREASKVSGSAARIIPIILLLIYIVIVFTFRSYSQPLMLLFMIPFSFIGVGWGHYIHGFPVNILSFLGIIALVGIMVNDGLVLISKFNSYLKEGETFNSALYHAGKSRFRAIFLTSITTVAGLAPLIFETSLQAQFLIPMAISIAYGITIATFLTLLTLPILLSLANDIKVLGKWLWTGKKPTKEEVERAVMEKKFEIEANEEYVKI